MINSVGNYYRPVAVQMQPQRQIQQSFKGVENRKEGMSKTSKTLLGLGALAAVGIGGFLLKKRIDISKAKSFIQRPEQFEVKDLLKIADNLAERGKLISCDRLCMIPKTTVEKFAKTHSDTKWFNIFKNSGMSDNGFVLAIRRNAGGKETLIFTPEPQFYIEPKKLGEGLGEFGKLIELPIK